MALGDGIRRNVATISQPERDRFVQALLVLDKTKVYPDGVSYWDKQEDIHKNAHAAGQDVHDGPAFLPWHRELCNRLEDLLREVDPELSLHYWDWTTDPRPALFTPQFMGSATGDAGSPLQDFESTEGGGHTHIWRSVNRGAAGAPRLASDSNIVTAGDADLQPAQYHAFLRAAQEAHNAAHGYIGGSIGIQHFSFHDPFVFLIHSNLDRLWVMWQLAPGKAWRLDPNQVYGNDVTAPSIVDNLEPWSGDSGLRPWAPPDNQQVVKNCKHPSVVTPPRYDNPLVVDEREPHIWLLDGRKRVEDIALTPPDPGWRVVGVGDFDGDGKADLLLRRSDDTGEARIWLLDGRKRVENIALTPPAPGWKVIGVGDFNGDGKADLLWRRSNDTGEARIWLLDGRSVVEDIGLRQPAPRWKVIGVGDFNGDGKADLLWRRSDDTGEARIWLLDGRNVVEDIGLVQPARGWRGSVGDFNGDGMADLLWVSAALAEPSRCVAIRQEMILAGDEIAALQEELQTATPREAVLINVKIGRFEEQVARLHAEGDALHCSL